MRCYRCGSKGPEGDSRDGQEKRRIPCYRCGAFKHKARDCRSTLRNQQTSRSGPTGGKPSGPRQGMGCAVRVRKILPQARLMEDDDLLEQKSAEKIKVLK